MVGDGVTKLRGSGEVEHFEPPKKFLEAATFGK